MIVLTCRLVPHEGQAGVAREAARALSARSQGHTVGYSWNQDPTSEDLHLVEVHQDEASLLHHVAVSDVSELAAAGSFEDIQYFGDAPSQALVDVLTGFGQVTVRREI